MPCVRQDANNWVIDGGEAYDSGGGGILLVSPSQDAIQEFTHHYQQLCR